MNERRPIAARSARWAVAIARALLGMGATPNAVSAGSVVFAVAAGLLLAAAPSFPPAEQAGLFVLAGLAIQGRLLCNLFDGMIAIEGKRSSPTGELWNDLPDRLSDTAILVGAGLAAGMPGLGWAAAAGALHVAYVRVLGRAVGARTTFVGPMAKQHRMAALTVGCVLCAAASFFARSADAMVLVLAVVVVGCVVTFLRRLRAVSADLRAGVR